MAISFIRFTRHLLPAVLAVATASIASADITFMTGNNPLDEENLLFNGPGTSNDDPVIGRLNQSDELFIFDSEDELVAPAMGQARIEGVDGQFVDLSFRPVDEDRVFTSVIFNLDVLNSAGDGTVQFTVTEGNGTITQSSFLDVDSNGQNFFTIRATNNQTIFNVALATTNTAFADIQQIRIGGEQDNPDGGDPGGGDPVPEPASMALFGGGLLGLAVLARRRRK